MCCSQRRTKVSAPSKSSTCKSHIKSSAKISEKDRSRHQIARTEGMAALSRSHSKTAKWRLLHRATFGLMMATVLASTACKTARKSGREALPFDAPEQLFNGTFRRFATSYHFSGSKRYIYTLSHKYGSVQEQGSVSIDTEPDILRLKPEYFICRSRNKNIRVGVDDFKPIMSSQKDVLITAYKRKTDDPDGLKDLLNRFKEAELSNQNAALAQELAREMVAKEVDSMQKFFAMIEEMDQQIEKGLEDSEEMQTEIDKKQKEIDLIQQEKFDASIRLDELNARKKVLEEEQDSLHDSIHQQVEEIEHLRKKIAFLLSEHRVSEEDLKRGLAHLERIDRYLEYTVETADYIQSNQDFLIEAIRDNEEIIALLDDYSSKIGQARAFYYKISSVRLHLDSKPVNSSSPGFDLKPNESPTNYVADCYQAALILMTRYLEEQQKVPEYQKDDLQ